MQEQYIADKKILGVTESEIKTPGGVNMIKVLFEDNTFEVMPRMRFEIVVSDKMSDATTVQNSIKDAVGKSLFLVMHEYGVKTGEIDGVLDQCTEFVNNGLKKASDILFGFERADITLNTINHILLEQHAKENNDGVSTTGGGADTENKG